MASVISRARERLRFSNLIRRSGRSAKMSGVPAAASAVYAIRSDWCIKSPISDMSENGDNIHFNLLRLFTLCHVFPCDRD